MKFSSNKKKVAAFAKRDELLKQRAAAETLRAVCPDAALLSVELVFQAESPTTHAPQRHALYPPAKAHFVYPCPYGDCDGTFNLQEVALGLLARKGKRTSGSLKCLGSRSREGATAVPCVLEVSYVIVAQYDVGSDTAATGSSAKRA
jgi:hypothetical protein